MRRSDVEYAKRRMEFAQEYWSTLIRGFSQSDEIWNQIPKSNEKGLALSLVDQCKLATNYNKIRKFNMEATRRKAGRPKKIEANEELKYDSASKSDDSSDASTEIIKALTIQLAALAKKMSEIENRVDQLESDQNDVLAPAIKSLGDQAVKANQLIDAAHARCQTLHNDLSELEDAFQTKMINEMPIDKPKQDKPKQAIENDLLASIRNIKF